MLAQRQLLSRCSLRWYSVGTLPANNSPGAAAASDTPVPPRLKRPSASSFGGINIQNVVIPTQRPRSRTNGPPRSGRSDGKSPEMHRTSRTERYKGHGKTGLSGWGDGLVSLSFSSRLHLHQKKRSSRSDSPSAEAQPREREWERQHKPAQRHPQIHGHHRGQKERGDASSYHTPRAAPRAQNANSVAAAATDTTTKPKAPLMTRPSASTFKLPAQPTTKATAGSAKASKANHTASSSASSNAAATQHHQTMTTSPSADRSVRLAALSSTNLNALFRTRDAPGSSAGAGVPLPSSLSLPPSASLAPRASASARVRSVLERSAGDYSRFFPRRVGVRKDASRLPALRTARHALAVQRDVSLDQRRVALHIIEGLARPRHSRVHA